MKSQFEIKDQATIVDILAKADYGTLALSYHNKPYALPMNFVYIEGIFYFHGSKKGKKIDMLVSNPQASLSVVEPFALIPSYFSTKENMACPASHFFRSVSIEGLIELVDNYNEKVIALEALMQKLQSEGGYISLSDLRYQKMVDVTQVFKLIPSEIRGKVKLGQHLSKERYEMIIEHLQKRGSQIDRETIESMMAQKGE